MVRISWAYVQLLRMYGTAGLMKFRGCFARIQLLEMLINSVNESPEQVVQLEYQNGKDCIKQLHAPRSSPFCSKSMGPGEWDLMLVFHWAAVFTSSNLVSLLPQFPQLYQKNPQPPTSQGSCEEAKAALCQGLGLLEGAAED